MLGWQDSDSDGVFDLLDVPMVLDGVGRFNAAASEYSFRGTAKTDTLPNLNSSGIQNDITLNRISRIEYRIDSGAWTTILTPNAYEVELDFKIPLSVSSGTLEIRAIDAKTSVTSNVFRGTIGAKADATTTSGISGFVWTDANSNGIWDPNEKARPGMNLRLVDANGQPVALQRSVEPDDRGVGEISPNSFAGVSLAAVGNDTDGSVGVFADTRASTGNKVLRPYSNGLQDFATSWRGNRHQLRVDFQTPTSFVSVDVIGADLASYGRLEAYSSAGVLLDRVTSAVLSNGRVQNLAIGRATADIAYIMIKGHDETGIVIDNIKFGPQSSTKTDALGRYSFPSLVAGTYQVEMVLPAQGYTPTSPATSKQSAVVVASQATPHVDFGVFYSGSPWNNELFPEDTNKDGVVTPLDALLVINQLNLSGSQSLDGSSITTPPFLDVTNDRILTPLDALFVINYLNLNGIGGEGEAKQFAEGPEEASGRARLISPDGEGSILPVWNRYADEVGPLLSNKEFQEKLMEPQWTLPEPCNCPYCDSFR